VNITLYGFVLFLHIATAIVGFSIAGVLHAVLNVMPRVRTVAEARPVAALVHRLEPILPIAALVLFGLGGWLIHLSDGEFDWGDGWIVTAIVTLVVVEGLAGALLAPRSKKLVAQINSTPDGPVPDSVRQSMLDPMIWDVAHVATMGFLGVVFLMSDKPSGGISVVIVVAAALIGIALSRWHIALAGTRSDARTSTVNNA
jgi:VanZ family protein